MANRSITRNGKVATLTLARKNYGCGRCHSPIMQGEHYWQVTQAGAGLGSIKFPERICVLCLDQKLEEAHA